uniref:(northern house mosquito) hypothetical protein n=1 Tax=Culex pipiens TaxID=7175 RepID=A0A8D8JQB0_CULPI
MLFRCQIPDGSQVARTQFSHAIYCPHRAEFVLTGRDHPADSIRSPWFTSVVAFGSPRPDHFSSETWKFGGSCRLLRPGQSGNSWTNSDGEQHHYGRIQVES